MRGLGRKGFTLLELMTVTVLMMVLGATAFAWMHSYLDKIRLRNTAEAVAADIRQARWQARSQSTACTIVFDTEQQAYNISGVYHATLPAGIRFGVDPTVSGKPSDPYEAPPQDGVSFDSGRARNKTRIQATGTVAPTGAVYLTNGKETMAITVAITGRPKIWKSCGGRKWVSL